MLAQHAGVSEALPGVCAVATACLWDVARPSVGQTIPSVGGRGGADCSDHRACGSDASVARCCFHRSGIGQQGFLTNGSGGHASLTCDGRTNGFPSSSARDHRPDISEYERWSFSFGSNRKSFLFLLLGLMWFHS